VLCMFVASTVTRIHCGTGDSAEVRTLVNVSLLLLRTFVISTCRYWSQCACRTCRASSWPVRTPHQGTTVVSDGKPISGLAHHQESPSLPHSSTEPWQPPRAVGPPEDFPAPQFGQFAPRTPLTPPSALPHTSSPPPLVMGWYPSPLVALCRNLVHVGSLRSAAIFRKTFSSFSPSERATA